MRRVLVVSTVLPLIVLGAAAACSSSTDPGGGSSGGVDSGSGGVEGGSSSGGDAAQPSDGGGDATDAEAPLTKQTEKEPNNGASATEVNAMTLPGEMTGAIDPANDVDIFSLTLAPGELYEWTLTPTSADLAPHLTVFDTAPSNLNPTRLVAGTVGAPSKLEHFVLRTGSFVAAVRDARNVPTAAGKGGPTYGYALVGRKKTPNLVSVSFPSTKTATLGSLSSLDLYTFNGTAGAGFDVVLKAARKTPPSTLDSRISLFDLTTKQTLITNDDAPGTTDSQIGGTFPTTGAYVLVVENEGTNPADLSYQLDFTLR
jgi:hypothetical protein